MANLWPRQYAGSLQGDVDLPSYISGYVDGEGCFTVSISPRPTLVVRWEVRPSLSVSQNGDRLEVLLLMQDYFGCGKLRPDRSDKTWKWEVRSLPLSLTRYRDSPFPPMSPPVREEKGLPAVRERMRADGSGRAPQPDRIDGDRTTGRWYEPKRKAWVPAD